MNSNLSTLNDHIDLLKENLLTAEKNIENGVGDKEKLGQLVIELEQNIYSVQNKIRECSSNCVILKIISQISVYLENKYPAGKLPKPNLISAYSI